MIRITDNPTGDERFPYVVVDPEDNVVHVDATPARAANWAWNEFGEEIEVRHDENLIKADALIFHRED